MLVTYPLPLTFSCLYVYTSFPAFVPILSSIHLYIQYCSLPSLYMYLYMVVYQHVPLTSFYMILYASYQLMYFIVTEIITIHNNLLMMRVQKF